MNYTKTVAQSLKTLQNNYKLSTMTGKQLYAAYGIHRGETLWKVAETFPDGYCMEIKSVAGEEDETAQISVLLLDQDGTIVADTSEDHEDDMVTNSYEADNENGDHYCVNVVLEPCAIPLRCEDDDNPYTAYINSKWLEGDKGDYLFNFLAEYTSDSTKEILPHAILAGEVAMIEYDNGEVKIPSGKRWILDAAKKQMANKANYLKAMQCLVDNGIERDEAYTVLEAMLAILNDADASDVLDQESVEQFEYDSAVEELKRAMFMNGRDDIEDFLGTEIPDSMEPDTIDNYMDEILEQMPPEDLNNYFKKYGIEYTVK